MRRRCLERNTMFRRMLHITKGYFLWRKYRTRFQIDDRTAVLVLTGEDSNVDHYALLHLNDYVKRKVADRAVIFVMDQTSEEQAKSRPFSFPTEVCMMEKEEELLFYDYYCFEEYFDNIAFTHVRLPEDNLLWRLLKDGKVNAEEAVCLGSYCLRRIPAIAEDGS